MPSVEGHRFFDDLGFEFGALMALGAAPYGMAEPGEVLATVGRIADGDPDSWFTEWMATADACLAQAGECEAAGRVASARWLYLRAAYYMGPAFFYVLATGDPSRELGTWHRHRQAFDRAMALWPTPVEAVQIPYEGITLKGWLFSGGDGPRPLVVFANGSDGTVTDILGSGPLDAVDRGYHALVFDGPGQGAALYEDSVYFRHDWEHVIGPVLDWALPRADVAGDTAALYGISQAGYWVPRAAAFEPRLSAVMADPGVVRVGDSWTRHMPPPMMQLIAAGDTATFDGYMAEYTAEDKGVALEMAKRLEPYGTSSIGQVLVELQQWDLAPVAGQITAPTWIASPDDEQFWPGQSEELAGLITSAPVTLQRFTRAEGANWHCEPAAPRVRAQRMLDWLDGVLT